ncbi:MAG: ABC transporter permease subunit [Bacilli bacterium]|nr:ABC transporter permease subunit [Bacilli bacterium]
MKDSIIKRVVFSATTILLLFLGWIIISVIKNNDLIYPKIDKIFIKLLECFRWDNFKFLLFTFSRVIISVGISLVVSILIIILYLKFPSSYSLFSPIIRMMRTMPFICISLFIIIIFSSNLSPYIIAFLLIIPLMTEGLKDGVDRLDKNLMDDLALHEIKFIDKLRLVYLPLIMPTIILTLLQTFGLGFKVMIMGEYFAQTKNSMGLVLNIAKSNLWMDEVIAWTILIVLVVSIIEILINIFNKKRNNIIY